MISGRCHSCRDDRRVRPNHLDHAAEMEQSRNDRPDASRPDPLLHRRPIVRSAPERLPDRGDERHDSDQDQAGSQQGDAWGDVSGPHNLAEESQHDPGGGGPQCHALRPREWNAAVAESRHHVEGHPHREQADPAEELSRAVGLAVRHPPHLPRSTPKAGAASMPAPVANPRMSAMAIAVRTNPL